MEIFYSSSYALLASKLARFLVAQKALYQFSPNQFATLTSRHKSFRRLSRVFRFTICHKTEVIKNNLNPVWQPFTIPVRALCNGDYDR